MLMEMFAMVSTTTACLEVSLVSRNLGHAAHLCYDAEVAGFAESSLTAVM